MVQHAASFGWRPCTVHANVRHTFHSNVFIYLCDAILHLRQHRMVYVRMDDNTQCLVSVMSPSSVSSHLVWFASSVLFLIEQFLFSIRLTVTMFNLNGIKNEWTHARTHARVYIVCGISPFRLLAISLADFYWKTEMQIYTEQWRQPLLSSYLRWEIYSVGQVKCNDGFMCVRCARLHVLRTRSSVVGASVSHVSHVHRKF